MRQSYFDVAPLVKTEWHRNYLPPTGRWEGHIDKRPFPLTLDSEIGVWMQGAAPSALIFMLTIFPGLTAGATLLPALRAW